jgi:hypothetical protein
MASMSRPFSWVREQTILRMSYEQELVRLTKKMVVAVFDARAGFGFYSTISSAIKEVKIDKFDARKQG